MDLWGTEGGIIIFPGDSLVKNPPINAGDAGSRSLDQEDPLEKEVSTHSNNLAWDDREAWWATVHGVARVRHDLATKLNTIIIYFTD